MEGYVIIAINLGPTSDVTPMWIKKNYVKNPYNFSIDRLDNDVTYQKGNIIFCHSLCNDIKHSVTIKMCERILKLYKMKKENNEME